ncbi:MAG: 2-oxoacid:acceptor oxidoreductase family protein, partial [Bacilli bacterium]|nr:2-oxoacid:acceptor oxidoreductase family protein [Bacilli bacterium]
DSRKAGGTTRSHLRFGKNPIHSEYYVKQADFISCSLDTYIFKFDIISNLKVGGTFLLNTNMTDEQLYKSMPNRMKHLLAERKAKFYVIDANKLALEAGMGRHTNTTLQAAFFKLSPKIMPYEQAEEWMKKFAKKTYEKKGMDVVEKNYAAIDTGAQGLREVPVDPKWIELDTKKVIEDTGDTYYDEYVAVIDRLDGDELPTSAFLKHELPNGTMNENITFRQKRAIADRVPLWNMAACIQCNQCALVCPHATIRPYLISEEELAGAPEIVKNGVKPAMATADKTLKFRIQVASENCIGCGLCVAECTANKAAINAAKKAGLDKPDAAKMALKMVDAKTQSEQQQGADYLYAHCTEKVDQLPAPMQLSVKGIGFKKPYMEVSGACAGCGEAPYYRLISQLFGKDMLVANATGCSSIYCGSTPLTPFVNDNGKDGVA